MLTRKQFELLRFINERLEPRTALHFSIGHTF